MPSTSQDINYAFYWTILDSAVLKCCYSHEHIWPCRFGSRYQNGFKGTRGAVGEMLVKDEGEGSGARKGGPPHHSAGLTPL